MAIVDIKNHYSQKVVEEVGFKKLETRIILNSGEKKKKSFYYYRFNRNGSEENSKIK